MKLEELASEDGYASTVLYSDGAIRRVKNLGWLRSHAREVESFILIAASEDEHADGFLIAEMYDWFNKTTYFHAGRWASYAHTMRWLSRPSFIMRKLLLVTPNYEQRLEIGTGEYKKIADKRYW